MKPKIALATNSEYPELIGGEVLLLQTFRSAGYDVRPAVWDNPSVDWHVFDFVILRSCWGYHKKVDEFRAWLDMLSDKGVALLNPQGIVRWNMYKGYLLELQQRGVPLPQTVLVRQGDKRNLAEILIPLKGDTFIVKPCYGADAFGIIKLNKTSAGSPETVNAYWKLLAHSDVLIQEFVPEIAAGEISAVFLDGKLSHAALKKPKQGEFRSQLEYGGVESRIELGDKALAQVNRLYAACNKKVLYARLDYVQTADGPKLMELELIEPYLFFDLDDSSAERFVHAFENFTGVTTSASLQQKTV